MSNEKNTPVLPLPEPMKRGYTYEELYKEYHPHLVKAFNFIVPNGSEEFIPPTLSGSGLDNDRRVKWLAEDLAQETMLKVFEIFDMIEFRTVRSLLSNIGMHLYIDYTRSLDGTLNARKYDGDPTLFIDEIFSDSCEALDPYSLLLVDRQFEDAISRIDSLRPIDQQIITAIFYEGVPAKDLEKRVGIKYGNIRARLRRLRIALDSNKDEE